MKVVFVLPSYYPDTFGGAERQSKILAAAMTRRGIEATILAPTCSWAAKGSRIEDGISVVRFYVRNEAYLGGKFVLSMISWWVAAFCWLAVNRRKYDVISVQHLRLHAAPAIVAAMLFGKVASGKLGRGGVHFDLRRLRRQRLPFGRLVAALAKRSRMIYVANSSEIVADLRTEGIIDQRIVEVPNGVECPNKPSGRYTTPPGSRLFVFAGRLEHEKGLPALVETFGQFAADRADAHLAICGSGPLRNEIEKAITAADLRGKVTIRGTLDRREDIYRDAAFMVLPSSSEGMSNALLEAMAFGVVPVVTLVSGVAGLVDDGRTGLILQDPGPRSIRLGLERAYAVSETEWIKMSDRARRRILDGYRIDEVAERYIDLYLRQLQSDDTTGSPPTEKTAGGRITLGQGDHDETVGR